MTTARRPWHQASYAHVLVDMHVPDWDAGFLAHYDPAQAVESVAACGCGAAMVYFQSHVGLCNWPTKSGKQHAAFAGRDPAREIVDLFHARDIPVCAYYSVNFNNWAVLEHPEWKLEPALEAPLGGGILPAARYGLCCLNNPGYRDFVRAQATEIAEGYDIDAMFFDMVWWQSVCVCDHCRTRCRVETGKDIPETVDWLDPDWCRYQAVRERWLIEFAEELRSHVRAARPDVPVYHNFAVAMMNWAKGISFESARAHDFLGGDFYGGREEQLVVSRLMLNLSEGAPVEFMTTVAANLAEHENLKSVEELTLQAFAATASASSFLTIVAINPDGTPNAEAFRRMGEVYRRTKPYDKFLGGRPVEDIAVYFSSDSKMTFAENGTPLIGPAVGSATQFPHFAAVRGACSKLQKAHLPFGIITRRQLDDLQHYRVIVLPNVLRMDAAEVEAFRAYVEQGGKLYASRMTSLTETSGVRHDDFMLADLFGASFDCDETGKVIHIRAQSESVEDAFAGQSCLSHWAGNDGSTGAVRLREGGQAQPLATLSLPYGYPHGGSVEDHHWASIHSSPRWTDTEAPVIVENRFGRGTVIYCAADIEAGESTAHGPLFVGLIRSLLDGVPTFESDTHPAVWVTAFDQSEQRRTILSFLNYQDELPVLPIADVPFRLRAPANAQFTRLSILPEGRELPFELDAAGTLRATLPRLGEFAMLSADYE